MKSREKAHAIVVFFWGRVYTPIVLIKYLLLIIISIIRRLFFKKSLLLDSNRVKRRPVRCTARLCYTPYMLLSAQISGISPIEVGPPHPQRPFSTQRVAGRGG